LGETMTVEVVSARKYSPKDSTGKTIKSITTQTLQQGSDGVATHTSITSDTVAGRLSWRQIHDYQQVRNTSP
jgi:type IV pilus assembly protein PilY1